MEEKIRAILREDDDAVGDLMDLIAGYQARAWDKGFGKGVRAYSGVKRIYAPPGPDKGNRNPYRHAEAIST